MGNEGVLIGEIDYEMSFLKVVFSLDKKNLL